MSNDRPPAGFVVNPAAIKAARQRGWPQTPQAISDAAKLENVPVHVEASDAVLAAGLAELAAFERDRSSRAADAAFKAAIEKEMGQ